MGNGGVEVCSGLVDARARLGTVVGCGGLRKTSSDSRPERKAERPAQDDGE